MQQVLPDGPDYARILGPRVAPAGRGQLRRGGTDAPEGPSLWLKLRRAVRWIGFGLMVWAANGLPIDLLRAAGLIPLGC